MKKPIQIKKYEEYINEAVVRTNKVNEYLNKIFNYVNSKTTNYNPLEYVMEIKKSDGTAFNGKMYLGFDGSAFRVNWKNDSKEDFVNIVGIDFWEKYVLDQNIKPDYSMHIYDSIVPILPVIADFIINPEATIAKHKDYAAKNESYRLIKEYYDEEEDNVATEDAPNPVQTNQPLDNNENDKKKEDSEKRFYVNNPYIDRMTNAERQKAKNNAIKNYNNASNRAEKQRYKELAETYAFSVGESEVMFDDVEDKGIPNDILFDPFYAIEEHTYTVASGQANSLLITGLGGLGKTFEVEKTLKEMGKVEDRDYEKVSGSITVPALYEKLFKNRNGLLLFDDCDSFWFDKEASNYLKAALDTKDVRVITRSNKNSFDTTGLSDLEVEERTAEYEGRKMPEKVRFTGQIIFISNLNNEQFDSAVLTRVIHVDVKLTREEIIARMDGILPNMKKSMPLEERMMAYHFLQDVTTKYRFKFALNMRTLQHCFSIIEGQKAKYKKPVNDIVRKIKRYNDNNELIEETIPTWQYLCHMFLVTDDKERSKKQNKKKIA